MKTHEKIKQLVKQGFTLNAEGDIMINDLPKETDRFDTVLYVYLDDIDTIYINVYKSSGLRTISDGDLLRNHNECQSNAKAHYVAILDALPFLSRGLKDPEPSDASKTGEIKQVSFTVDPLFITLHLLKLNYEKIEPNTLSKSAKLTLSDMLYTNPLTDEDLTALWEQWISLYDSDNKEPFITISGEQTQINQLFDLLCQSERYQIAQRKQYITGKIFRQHYTSLDLDTLSDSVKATLSHMLYTDPLTEDELTGLWNNWQTAYDSEYKRNDLIISGTQTQINQLFDLMYQSERYQTEYKKQYLTGIDYDYAVVDLKAGEVMVSEFGEHYMTIITLINKNHSDTFYTLSQEEKDAFILANFNLVGHRYENKQYYVDSVNESIPWYRGRHE